MSKGCSGFETQAPKLSENFAEEVMELELDVELNQNVDIQKVNRLIELYTNAVEYYESIKSNKYIIFKNKIINLMLRPSVSLLAETQSPDSKNNQSPTNRQDKDVGQIKREKLDFTLQLQTKQHELSARKMMVGTDTKLQNVQKRISNEISKQQLKIQERLRLRKGKAEVASIGSTESDPKEKEARQKDDLFSFETILQSDKIFQEGIIEEHVDIPLNQPQIQVPNDKIVPPIKINPQKKKAKKQVLTLKPNQKPISIPDQYSIPF